MNDKITSIAEACQGRTPPVIHAAIKALVEGAELLDRHGWIQFTYAMDGKRCAVGAVHAVLGDEDSHYLTASYLISDAFTAAYGVGVIQFNDTPGRTADEVKKAMRDVARLLEQHLADSDA